MTVIAYRARPFFEDKNRAFWMLQALGWSAAFLLRAISGVANGQPLSFVLRELISTITRFSLSLLMGTVFQAVLPRKPFVTWSVSILSTVAATAVGSLIDAWVWMTMNVSSD